MKPFENVVIEPNRDSRLAFRHGNYWPRFALLKSYPVFAVLFFTLLIEAIPIVARLRL